MSPCWVFVNMIWCDMIWVMHIFISSSPVALPKPLFPHLLKILVKLGLFGLFRTFVLLMVLLRLWLLFLKFWKLLPLFHKLALHLLQLKPLLRRRPQIVKSIFLKSVVATSTSSRIFKNIFLKSFADTSTSLLRSSSRLGGGGASFAFKSSWRWKILFVSTAL